MTPEQINKMAADVHVLNRKWWPENIEERNKSEILILITSEVIECMEGERKDLMDDKLPHRKMAEVEMADTAIRVLDAMGAFKANYIENSPEDAWCSFADGNNKVEDLFCIVGVITGGAAFRRVETFLSNILYLVIKYCEKYGYDLWGAVEEKLAYNMHREDHKLEVRMAEGGKKW